MELGQGLGQSSLGWPESVGVGVGEQNNPNPLWEQIVKNSEPGLGASGAALGLEIRGAVKMFQISTQGLILIWNLVLSGAADQSRGVCALQPQLLREAELTGTWAGLGVDETGAASTCQAAVWRCRGATRLCYWSQHSGEWDLPLCSCALSDCHVFKRKLLCCSSDFHFLITVFHLHFLFAFMGWRKSLAWQDAAVSPQTRGSGHLAGDKSLCHTGKCQAEWLRDTVMHCRTLEKSWCLAPSFGCDGRHMHVTHKRLLTPCSAAQSSALAQGCCASATL